MRFSHEPSLMPFDSQVFTPSHEAVRTVSVGRPPYRRGQADQPWFAL